MSIKEAKRQASATTRIPPPVPASDDTDAATVAVDQVSTYPGNEPDEVEILPPESGAGRSTNFARGPPDGLSTKQTRLGESLVSKRELARFLGISVSGLDKLIARGRVPPFVKVGRLLKWAPADVRNWAAQMQREVRLQHET
jgi:predicted DNA-binding transcriptional regulator AlpA